MEGRRDGEVDSRSNEIGDSPSPQPLSRPRERGSYPGAETESLFDRKYRATTIGAVVLVALYAFEALAVATAMPTVAQALDGLPLYALAFGGTLASSVIGMVACGPWADRRGPAPPLRHGIVWFSIGLLIAGFASSMEVLLLGRIVQGFGGGLMSVALYVAVGRVYPPAMHPRIFSSFAAAWVVPAVIGPTIAGALVEHLGWRWVFLSVPLLAMAAAACVLPALRNLREGEHAHDDGGLSPHRLAWAVGAAASALALHYAGQRHGAAGAGMLAISAIALVVCAWHLLPRGTLRAARGLPTVVMMRGIASGAFFGTEVFIPLLLSRERGLSPTMAGAALTLGALGWSLGSWCRSRPSQPFAPSQLLRYGMSLIVAGIAGVACAVSPSVPVSIGIVGWIAAGFGMGLLFPTLSVLILELSPPNRQGVNSSALHLCDALFTATVLAVGGSVFAALLTRAPSMAYLVGFAISAALALLGALLASRVRPVA
ncbi:MFS transporter [Lysobacter soli]|uniref:MFS transporter n=1 Tax=Lysobacter soli TaxID=453783 RepID=A0A3D8VIK0_9GAMM|nr:MFS transporter [Lysobacter soli]RDY69207.1 MFS transporter [Lysobacter soli]